MNESFAELLAWFEAGKIKPHVSHVFAMDEIGEAMSTILQRKSTGKVVVLTESGAQEA